MEKKRVSIIVAMSQNYAIGRNNELLWHIPNDLRHFKEITLEHTVIMGKKTYESLYIKPLPNRRNIVLTTNKDLRLTGCEMVYSVEEALNLCSYEEQVFVIGGETIYKQFMPYADIMYVTWVYENFEGDAYFPEINPMIWQINDQSEIFTDEKTGLQYAFFTYTLKQ